MKKKEEAYYIHAYTLKDKTKKEPWRSFKQEKNVLGITYSDIFQIQMVLYDPNKGNKQK
ncbi:hypothetical protein OF830_26395 [Bacillus paramycoides]|uniref:hypothetical protein n=1 Tax=Bacillus paramycoides TaxID=2026194 RepID=UPI00224479B4|nr:hypothetical protein [Bacillus paramycoides]MCW9134318.1 hypothetical protein [Bacillus paramycoides]